MKRLLTYVLILGGVMLAALSGCQKEEVEPAKAKTYNIFENVGTNPYIQNLVSYLKQKGDTASFRKTFALEYGIPLWRKATVLKQGSVTSMLVPLKDCEANFISGIWIFEVKDGYIRYNVARNEQCKSYYKELEPFFRELEQSLFGIKQKGAGYMRKGGILKGFEEVQTEYCVWTNVCDGPWVLHCWYVHDLSFYRDEDGDAGSSGGGVIPDPKPEVDTKDPSFKDTKADCVFKKLVGATATTVFDPNTVTGNLLKDFFSDKYSVKFKIVSASQMGNKITANAETYPPTSNNEIEVWLKDTYVNSSSMVEIARTLIHESIHAQIFMAVKYPNEAYSSDANFADLWKRYQELGKQAQHNVMAESSYIAIIAKGVEEYHKNNRTVFEANLRNSGKLDGFNYAEFYNSLAWVGLQKTNKYNENQSTDSLWTKRIQDYLGLALNNDTNNCSN